MSDHDPFTLRRPFLIDTDSLDDVHRALTEVRVRHYTDPECLAYSDPLNYKGQAAGSGMETIYGIRLEFDASVPAGTIELRLRGETVASARITETTRRVTP